MSRTLYNRHIVDQLADTRAAIKDLQKIEGDLKERISAEMGDRDSLGGNEFIASQVISERKGSIDAKALAAAGIDVDQYRKPATTVLTLRVEPRVAEAA